MPRLRAALLFGALLVLAAIACNAIVGIEPATLGTTSSDAGVDGGDETADVAPCDPGLYASKTGCVGWAGWPMPNPPNDAGWPNVEDYDLSQEAAGVVIDRVTGLTWQRAVDTSGTGLSWSDARAYCDGLSLAGHTDWRLPTRIELVSIVDFTHLPSVDAVAFPGTPSAYFWTISTVAATTNKSWYVRFDTGGTGSADPSTLYRVRCVR